MTGSREPHFAIYAKRGSAPLRGAKLARTVRLEAEGTHRLEGDATSGRRFSRLGAPQGKDGRDDWIN